MTSVIPLFREYPGLCSLPRIELIDLPTPVHKLFDDDNLPDTWIKRDDLSNSIYGGNKPRKYEFILADALRKKKEYIITVGGLGSNHALAITYFAKKQGLDTRLYLYKQPLTEHVRNNLLRDKYFGAKINYWSSKTYSSFRMILHQMFHRKAYSVWIGASSPLGTVGFVNAAFELADQINEGLVPEPDRIIVPVGSKGTIAGLLLGMELSGLKTSVLGFSVAMKSFTNKKRILVLANKTLRLLQELDSSIPDAGTNLEKRLEVSHEYFGSEYGRATHEALVAVEIARRKGIKLETTYSGKALSGLIGYSRRGLFVEGEKILFWNTYNSADLSYCSDNEDYRSFPKKLQELFDGTIPLDHTPVQACDPESK